MQPAVRRPRHHITDMTDTGNAATSVERFFCNLMSSDANLSAAIAAMRTLLMVLEETNCEWINATRNTC